jgi:hypothetical protein
MTTIDTDAIRRNAEEVIDLIDGADTGPWIVAPAFDVEFVCRADTGEDIARIDPPRGKTTARFIADARTRVPSQAELLKECADEIDRLRNENKHLYDSLRGIGDMLFFPQSTIEGVQRTWNECYAVARAATGRVKVND